MCTVSFISTGKKYILTSNRDEHISRAPALYPDQEIINNCRVIFPKDPQAGGSWFAINENGVTGVLLNGAFHKHTRAGKYSTSRGVVLLNIVSNPTPSFYFSQIELVNIEPFTIILFESGTLLELRWDGVKKYRKELDTNQNYIWSSVTLYDQKAIQKREALFNQFHGMNTNPDEESIIRFHSENYDDLENGFIINRNNKLKTFSITQAIFEETNIIMKHYDLLKEELNSIAIKTNHIFNQVQ